jgi:hypothetical protein
LCACQNYWSQAISVCAVRIEPIAVSERDAIGCNNDACSQIIHAINMASGSPQITSLGIQMTKGLSLTIIVIIIGFVVLTAVAYNAV